MSAKQAAIAIANKTARIAWVRMVRGGVYEAGHRPPKIERRRARLPAKRCYGASGDDIASIGQIISAHGSRRNEDPRDGLLSHIGGLLGRGHGLEQIEESVRTDVVSELQHLWMIAPELMLQTVGKTNVLNLDHRASSREEWLHQ